MAFMRRDVNIGLLILIIVAAIVFSGFSVYYQTTFQNVSLEYKNKLEQLSKVSTELTKQKEELNTTYSLRVKAEQDRETLDTRYNEVRGENDQLIRDNTNLRLDLSGTKIELAVTQTDLENKRVQLAQSQADLAAANSKITSLNNDLDKVCVGYAAKNNGVEHEE